MTNKEIKKKLKNELSVIKRIDDDYWQKGYPKFENQIVKKIEELLESQQGEILKEMKKIIEDEKGIGFTGIILGQYTINETKDILIEAISKGI